MASKLVAAAAKFAQKAHSGQTRKYDGEPYWTHLNEVAELCRWAGLRDEVIAAAWLHDTIEDTPVTFEDIENKFGRVVADLVLEVTDQSKPGDGNRAVRKEIDRKHVANASPDGQSIKLADLTSNTRSIVSRDPNFARLYLVEKERMLPALTKGSSKLFELANKTLADAKAQLGIQVRDPAQAG